MNNISNNNIHNHKILVSYSSEKEEKTMQTNHSNQKSGISNLDKIRFDSLNSNTKENLENYADTSNKKVSYQENFKLTNLDSENSLILEKVPSINNILEERKILEKN